MSKSPDTSASMSQNATPSPYDQLFQALDDSHILCAYAEANTKVNDPSFNQLQVLADIHRRYGDSSFVGLTRESNLRDRRTLNVVERSLAQSWANTHDYWNLTKRKPQFKYRGTNDTIRALQETTFELNDTLNDIRRLAIDESGTKEDDARMARQFVTTIIHGDTLYNMLAIENLDPIESKIARDWTFAVFPSFPHTRETYSTALLHIAEELNKRKDSDTKSNTASSHSDKANDTHVTDQLKSLGHTILHCLSEEESSRPTTIKASYEFGIAEGRWSAKTTGLVDINYMLPSGIIDDEYVVDEEAQ